MKREIQLDEINRIARRIPLRINYKKKYITEYNQTSETRPVVQKVHKFRYLNEYGTERNKNNEGLKERVKWFVTKEVQNHKIYQLMRRPDIATRNAVRYMVGRRTHGAE